MEIYNGIQRLVFHFPWTNEIHYYCIQMKIIFPSNTCNYIHVIYAKNQRVSRCRLLFLIRDVRQHSWHILFMVIICVDIPRFNFSEKTMHWAERIYTIFFEFVMKSSSPNLSCWLIKKSSIKTPSISFS